MAMQNKYLDEFFSGNSVHAHEIFGTHKTDKGISFTLYAPLAKSVRLKGDFNGWNADTYLTKIDYRGVWNVVLDYAQEYQLYQYEIETQDGKIISKADPYAKYSELRPNWSSIIIVSDHFKWTDSKWMKQRSLNYDKPMNIYEVFAGGWKRDQFGNWYTYNQLKEELIPYVKENGYTHIEFMPLMNHPFDGSWGYQISGFYSCTSRYGTIEEFQSFVNECHKEGIGVIMDFVAVHFASDGFGLVNFDGSKVYEYQNENEKSQWGSYNFDLGKDPVRSFLISAAYYWIDNFHLDGLRMDAVSNMIFYDGNKNRGENIGALTFIKRFNEILGKHFPEVMMIAEDSSDYPNVTKKIEDGGLGFHYKWDLGWMNDTLNYYKRDPIFRQYHQNNLSFSMMYFWSEKFIMPLSHDEVVHGKATILDKMWGLYGEKFAQCKNLNVYMMTHPGKKLNFMGNEIGHFREFDEAKELDWFLLKYPMHDSYFRSVCDLNHLYLNHSAFWKKDYSYDGFKWIDADNASQSTFSYYREDDECFVVVLNMTPVLRENFVVGVPHDGKYLEVYNSEDEKYSGCGLVNPKPIASKKGEFKDFKNIITITLAPFAGVIFQYQNKKVKRKTK